MFSNCNSLNISSEQIKEIPSSEQQNSSSFINSNNNNINITDKEEGMANHENKNKNIEYININQSNELNSEKGNNSDVNLGEFYDNFYN
jgi:hypothetical protein